MIYCFDLDGTLCTSGAYETAQPYRDRIALVNNLYDNGHTIIIDTARGSVSGKDWTEFTRNQIGLWGIKYHCLRCGVKFAAQIFVDDRAKTWEDLFSGNSFETDS